MTSPVQREFAKLSQRFDAISLREQVLLLVCGVVVVGLLCYLLIFEPQQAANHKLASQINSRAVEVQALKTQVDELTAALQRDPDADVKQRNADIKQQLLEVDLQLADQTSHLVPADKMPQMLENVLYSSKGLKVISLQSIPPTPIIVAAQQPVVKGSRSNPASAVADSGQTLMTDTGLYRHGVKLELEGRYFDIQRYLEKLEALEWQFYWKKFDYTVGDYPVAKVELEIYTLSTSKAFIGV